MSATAAQPNQSPSFLQAARPYTPVILIFAFLIVATSAVELSQGVFDWHQAMNVFMGGFFISFSALKFANVHGFADNFAQYDIIASKSRLYALAYPVIELVLGIAYLASFAPFITAIVTIIITGIGSIGVIKSIRGQKEIHCACVGSEFSMPLSKVALSEDLLMLGMAALMIVLLATGTHSGSVLSLTSSHIH